MRRTSQTRYRVTLFLTIFVSALSFVTASAFGITIPEKLVYDLTWSGLKAGTAVQEIARDGDTVKILSTARSASWLTVFFPVDDRIESVLGGAGPTNLGLPMTFRMKIKEGKTRRDKLMQFDQANRTAHYTDYISGEKKTMPIPDRTFDTLSSFYHLRTFKLEVGKSIFIPVFDGKKIWDTEVQVLRKEKIKTVLGSFNTIVVKPVMKYEGILDKKGDMFIWLTDDSRLVPVKMKTKVAVGSITATLVGGTF